MLSHYMVMLSHTLCSHTMLWSHMLSHYAVDTAIIFTRPMPRRELSVLDILKSFAVWRDARARWASLAASARTAHGT